MRRLRDAADLERYRQAATGDQSCSWFEGLLKEAPIVIQTSVGSWETPYRVEAVAAATRLGYGVRMEVGDWMTYFYADPEVPVGKVAVHAPLYLTTLDSPEQEWRPW